ncbi:hypothetical protein [Listeria booriae]|uniref:hypothetical protein n=1 Tax=Listeria booriae TaxID=1552123 RepID=UPI00162A5A04|nr:hypothetical protein [Listeria booriae]MBC2392194.1 hypothetical protein [Listeria booriae]
MATKSFHTDFIFNKKSAQNLAKAIESSKPVKIEVNKHSKTIRDKDTIRAIMSSLADK